MPELPRLNQEKLELLGPKKREKALKALKELEHARRVCPPLFYQPHPKQELFHSFRTKNKVFLGGNQSGKTTAGIMDDIIQAVDEDVLPGHLRPYKKFRPPFACWIAAGSREVVETVIFQKIEEWIPKEQLLGEEWRSAYDRQLHILHFKNGSKIYFRTYEQELDKWGGASIDRIHFDEEPPQGHLGEGRIRTMAKHGDLLFTMTPTEGLSHMFDWLSRYVERAENEGGWMEDENLGLVLVDMDDNPHLDTEEKRLALTGFSREEIQARKHGKFVALHGLIYAEFNKRNHVIPEEHTLPSNRNVIVGIDPGIRHACGVIWTYLTPDDRMVAFEEGYYQDMTIREVCEQIHKVNAHYECQPIYYVIDPAARNRSSQTGRSDQMEFVDHGIVTIAGQNSVTAGINRVKERLENDHLMITANCENLISELQRYRWRKPPRTEDEGKEVPVKKGDHLLDSLRYVCASRPYLPKELVKDNETREQRRLRMHIESVSQDERVSAA
jgi:phage terminase large subunit-like protein